MINRFTINRFSDGSTVRETINIWLTRCSVTDTWGVRTNKHSFVSISKENYESRGCYSKYLTSEFSLNLGLLEAHPGVV